MMPASAALVTGASRGIGRACALRLAKEGFAVAVNYRQGTAQAGAVVQEITDAGGTAFALPGDVAVPGEADRLVHEVTEKFGRIDVLVNNAGITRDTLVLRMSDDDFDAVLATNLAGAFRLIRAALKPMLRQRYGRIINISSIAGMVGNPGQANYSAAKAGMLGLTRAVAKEVASRNITVNAVAPGLIDTDMSSDIKGREALVASIPLGRAGTPEEVAAAVAFLARQEAAYITGVTLPVDGGLTAG
ncbi:MAG: 3-oxoacyl-[acyl-carrier-protein] reductase [Thermaerobacter sp.]|nr:3-oxoacyl-[acyl-carrier-protein] reductase [Thermaerobacter sp.]